ncbi:hypothetical protein ACFXPJ_07350, partial [Streptomyces goshikiensis]
MGIFDFLKSDKKKAHEAADTAKGQVEEKGAAPPAVAAGPGSAMGGKYVDAAEATKAAAERMAGAGGPGRGVVTPPPPRAPPPSRRPA